MIERGVAGADIERRSSYQGATGRLVEYRRQIAEIRKKMREIQANVQPEPVRDYEFQTVQGIVRLSALFGDKDDLIIVHNMGSSCPYCTLWADGYNGIYDHLQTRVSFVIASPDPPIVQRRFAASRGWKCSMVSDQGTTFAEDMGYRSRKGGLLPGVSVFRRDHAQIVRVSDAGSNPHDDFCVLWHLLDLLPDGAAHWAPGIRYA